MQAPPDPRIPGRERFNDAIARFDRANAADPNQELVVGVPEPKELVYARRMTARLATFTPYASAALKLAARCQHIRRWTKPRSEYLEGREGYRSWREDLARFHAETAAGILREVGYDTPTIARVASLVRKERMKTDPEAQLLEDVVCLVFLEFYLDAFAAQHPEPKIIDILRRTWRKMSERGREVAMTLDLAPELRALVERAVGG
jgi:hypothetical protein